VCHVARSIQESELFFISGLRKFKSLQNILGSDSSCKNLKNGKSCGMDGILNEMIKYGQHALLPCLEKLFNIILSSGTYPKIWGEGYLITIFKKGSPVCTPFFFFVLCYI
jgi:hypothetical protein